ncbi:UNVERIFIED_CONTAM: putative PurR-regulated permease PerM [Acetivibrio alkalicellulosi]
MFLKNKKIPHIEFIPILVIAFLLYKLINNPYTFLSEIQVALSFVFSLFSYLIWAFAIAYFLNPIMVLLEKKLKIRRIFSILIIYVFLVAVVVFAITIITPALTNSVKQLSNDLPRHINHYEIQINELIEKLQSYDHYNVEIYIRDNLEKISSRLMEIIDVPIEFLLKTTMSLTSNLLKFVFGLIISIYMLSDKEKIARGAKKLLYAFFTNKNAYTFIGVGKKTHYVFSKYLFGKSLDSVIIAILCFIILSIFKLPFALLISIIVGITNMIPYVGPFIGAVPAIIITLFISPIQALWVAIIIVLLQQFDGWYLGPKIIGDQVGISPLLIITAIIVGGGLFGLLGMFLGVPIIAVIKIFIDEYVDKKLKTKGLGGNEEL